MNQKAESSQQRLLLTAGGCSLVPLRREHLPVLFKWETDGSSAHLWTNRRSVPSALEYEEYLRGRLRTYYHCLFMIEHGRLPIGFIYSYDVNLTDGYAFVTVFLDPSARRRGQGVVASLLMYEYLFTTFPIRKIYCDVFEYNGDSLSPLKGGGFVCEGEFHEHRFHSGSYHTMYRLALTRRQFDSNLASILTRVRRRQERALVAPATTATC